VTLPLLLILTAAVFCASFYPKAGLRYNQVNIDSYTEKDADNLNMNVKIKRKQGAGKRQQRNPPN
jgi:hypothetical protein